jgi:cytidylate kinase
VAIITIARQFGAGGETVGQILAQRLGADLLDRAIMDEVARRLQLPDEEIEAHDEHPGSLIGRLLTALGTASVDVSAPPEVVAWTPPYADPAFDPRQAVLNITQEVIREAARTGNAVIVGRGGAYLLRDHPQALHAFLQAAMPVRIATVMRVLGVGEEQARHRIRRTDTNRGAYIRQVYGHDWRHPSHYDLVLDTGRLGYEAAADALVAALKGRTA